MSKLDKQKIQQLEPIINKHCHDPKIIIKTVWEYYEKITPYDIHVNFPGFKFGWGFNTDDTNKSKLLVVEQPPMVRLLKFKEYPERKEIIRPYSLPYMVFVIQETEVGFPETQCFCRKKPLVSMKDIVYQCPLPNTTSANFICLGKDCEIPTNFYSPTEDLLLWFFEEFWSSSFTNDMMENLDNLAEIDPDHFKNMETWAQWSQTKPEYALQAPYQELGQLGELKYGLVYSLQKKEERFIYNKIKYLVTASTRRIEPFKKFFSEL